MMWYHIRSLWKHSWYETHNFNYTAWQRIGFSMSFVTWILKQCVLWLLNAINSTFLLMLNISLFSYQVTEGKHSRYQNKVDQLFIFRDVKVYYAYLVTTFNTKKLTLWHNPFYQQEQPWAEMQLLICKIHTTDFKQSHRNLKPFKLFWQWPRLP